MKVRYCYVGILLVATAFSFGSVNCAQSSTGGNSPALLSPKLIKAVYEGRLDLIKDFISSQRGLVNSSMRHSDGKCDTMLDFAIDTTKEDRVVDIVQYLIENGATLTQTEKTTLHRAVMRGNEALVKLIFNADKELLNVKWSHLNRKLTPFHVAIIFQPRKVSIVKYLIKQGAQLYPTLLHEVISSFTPSDELNTLIDEILKKDEDLLNVQDDDGFTPLMRAIYKLGNKKTIAHLLTKPKLSLTPVEHSTGGNALVWAIRKDYDINVINDILEKEPSLLNSLSWKGKEACTPLHEAIKSKRSNVIKALLDRKVQPDLSIKNGEGRSPFYLAAIEGNVELVKKLAGDPKLTIDFNETDSQDMTLLYRYASLLPVDLVFNEDIFKLLLSKNASLIAGNGVDKETVLHAVLENMNNSSDKSAQAHGKKVFDLLFNGDVCNESRLIMALLEANKEGITPLQYVLHTVGSPDKNDKNCVKVAAKMLTTVEKGSADFKKLFKTTVLDKLQGGSLPLHQAVMHGFGLSIIKQLLALGAHPLQKDIEGLTPLQRACKERIQNLEGTFEFLEEAEKRALQPSVQPTGGALDRTTRPEEDPHIKQHQKQDFSENPGDKSTSESSALPQPSVQPTGDASNRTIHSAEDHHIQQRQKQDSPENPGDKSTSESSALPQPFVQPTGGASDRTLHPAKDPHIKQRQKQDSPENPRGENDSTGELSQSNSVNRSTSDSSALPQRQVQSGTTSLMTKEALIGVVIAIPTVAALIYGIKKMMSSNKKQSDENEETACNRQETAYTRSLYAAHLKN